MRERTVGGEVEIGEEGQVLAEEVVLRSDGLLDLDEKLGVGPGLGLFHELGAGLLVVVGGEAGTGAGIAFDEDVVPVPYEDGDAGRGETDPRFLRLGFLDGRDAHGDVFRWMKCRGGRGAQTVGRRARL